MGSFKMSVDWYFPSLMKRSTILPSMPAPKSTYSHVMVEDSSSQLPIQKLCEPSESNTHL